MSSRVRPDKIISPPATAPSERGAAKAAKAAKAVRADGAPGQVNAARPVAAAGYEDLSTRSLTGFTPAVPFLSRLSRPPKYQRAASARA
jgi:hypothetical protein